MTITICGSLSHYKKGLHIKNELEHLGFDVLWPYGMEELQKGAAGGDAVRFKSKNHGSAIKIHYDKIKKADAILVVNEEKNGTKGYIGGNTLMEMGFAYVLDKLIYVLNPLPEKSPYREELVAMEPVVLNNDISRIYQKK